MRRMKGFDKDLIGRNENEPVRRTCWKERDLVLKLKKTALKTEMGVEGNVPVLKVGVRRHTVR